MNTMNTILVATDFSADAHWGTDYALELARQLHAQLIVLHAYEPPATPTAAPNGVASQGGVQYEQAIKKLCQLQSQMQNATNFPVDVTVVARPGSPATCLADEAINLKALETYSAQHTANLIMLLPKSCSRLRTFLLDSDTQKVVRLARTHTASVLATVCVRAKRLLRAPYRKDTGADRLFGSHQDVLASYTSKPPPISIPYSSID